MTEAGAADEMMEAGAADEMTRESMSNPNAFKHGLGKEAIRRIARNIKRVRSSFPDEKFVRAATAGLQELELKARVDHVVLALRQHLPNDALEAVGVLVRAGESWDEGDPSNATNGFAAWPVVELVGAYGLDHFDASMEALRKLTRLFSAEFAIRQFLERDASRALKRLANWARDPDLHVRRLVSEGTRPRLPWGRRLRQFQDDPLPVIELLEKLKDDKEEYVRRSVANNLNDIAKDHPELVVDLCRRWSAKATEQRQWIIKRATRTLVKEGHPAALALLGFDPGAKVSVESLSVRPKKLRLGENLAFSFEVRSRSSQRQSLAIDFAVHHVKQNGIRSAKVFKLKTLSLEPRGTASITKIHKLREITTRAYYSGRHAVEILVNGKSRAIAEFDLLV